MVLLMLVNGVLAKPASMLLPPLGDNITLPPPLRVAPTELASM